MAKFGRGRMPHLGSEYPDWEGIKLVHRWIAAMEKPAGSPAAPSAKGAGLDGAIAAPATALEFAKALATGAVPDSYAPKVLAAAAKLPPGPSRDLFEGYLPPDPKGRKIGTSPRPASILSMRGDPRRGEEVFFAKDLKCAECHKMGDKGVSLGPDLSAIGKARNRAELLESLLEPSRRIEPQYTSHLVKTADGRTLTGLLVKRDEKQLILRDAQNKELVLDAADVETTRPSRVSLMPDGLVSGLTPQEAADLLEFLTTRK
jgi:putative heme-binding domain-containing protein